MKTIEAQKKALSPVRLALLVTLIAGFCILNCVTLQARDYRIYATDQPFPFKELVQDEPNEIYQVQGWLLDFHTRIVALIVQQRISNNYYSRKHSSSGTSTKTPDSYMHKVGREDEVSYGNLPDIYNIKY